MSLHFPVLWPLGITPKRLTWREGAQERGNGPSMRPRASSAHGEVLVHHFRMEGGRLHVGEVRSEGRGALEAYPEPLA